MESCNKGDRTLVAIQSDRGRFVGGRIYTPEGPGKATLYRLGAPSLYNGKAAKLRRCAHPYFLLILSD